MSIVITVASGLYQGRRIPLRPGQLVKVGRTEWADFALPDDSLMSGVHFSLRCGPKECVIEDLESTNGTQVNGQRILQTVLRDGDSICAGRTLFTVKVDQTAAAGPRPGPVLPERPPSREALQSAVRVTVADRRQLTPLLLAAAASSRPYDKALVDEDPGVRREALLAAARTSQRWLLEYCRAMAIKPSVNDWDALWLLAVLGQPSDVERILAVGRTASLGSRRFALYASFGHPRVMKDLLIGISQKDPNTAVAAGNAFTRITGADIDSQDRVTLPPEDGSEPNEFEKEFLDEAFLPSLEKAEHHWHQVSSAFAQGTRWRRGLDLSRELTPELFAQLDLEARWEAALRGRYDGTWNGNWQETERLGPVPS